MDTQIGPRDCDRSAELLQLEWDAELAPAEAEELAEHLAACAACRQRLVGLGEVRALLGAWADQTEPSPTRSPADADPPDRPWLLRLELAAAGLLIGATLWWAFMHQLEPPAPGGGLHRQAPLAGSPSRDGIVSNVRDGVLCLQLPTEAPDVHVVWLYALSNDDPDPSLDSNGDDR